MPGRLPRQIHAPKEGRVEVSGNGFQSGRAWLTTEGKAR